jgi:branched-chain amino acid transport system substrate-binding protein
MARTHRTLLCLLLIVGLFAGATGCSQDEPVVVGVILPLTGEFAIYGEPIRRGIELALEELQAQEGYPYKLDLRVVDSEGDPAKAAQELEALYDAGAPAVIGGVTTGEALAMVEVADRADRVLLSPSASSPELTGVSSNFFRVFPSDFEEGTKMGYFASQTLDVDEVVIAAAESQYAKGIQQVFLREFENRGGTVTEVVEYPARTNDLGGVIDRIMTVSPPAVYLADYAPGLEILVSGLGERGYDGTMLSTSSLATPEFVEAVGSAANGVFFTQSNYDVTSEAPLIQAFVQSFEAEYDKVPDLYAAHGYDAMRVFGRALQEGGGRRPSHFWQGMRGITNFPGVTGPIQFDEQGDVQKFPRVYVIRNGEFVDYDRVLGERRRDLEERRRSIEQRMKELQRQQRGLRNTDG